MATPEQWFYIQRQQEQQIRSAQAAAAAAAKAEQVRIAQAREQTRRSGATCDIVIDEQSRRVCAVPGAGRCSACGRVFCQSHQSNSPILVDRCLPCQETARREEERKAAEARRRDEEAAARDRREREERRNRELAAHDARVTAHEATGPGRASVERRRVELARWARFRPLPFWGVVLGGGIVLLCPVYLLLGRVLINVYDIQNGGDLTAAYRVLFPGTLVLAFGLALLVWLLYNNVGKARHDEWQRLGYAVGCGDRTCARCYAS